MVGVALEAVSIPKSPRYMVRSTVSTALSTKTLWIYRAETTENPSLCATPSSGLGSPDAGCQRENIQVFRAHNVRYFFYIGGNDYRIPFIVNERQATTDFKVSIYPNHRQRLNVQ